MKSFLTPTFAMNIRNIFCAVSKSATTPSLSGFIETMCAGVRPTMLLASWPTESISPVSVFIQTMLGSFRTIPLFDWYITVFAVPMSMARLRPNGFRIYRTSPSTAYLGEFDFRPNPAFDVRRGRVNIGVGLCWFIRAPITS